MTERELDDKILAWCHKKDTKRVIGMRTGRDECLVMYLDTWKGAYNEDGTHNLVVVLFAGATWEEVLSKIEAHDPL